MAAYYVYNRKSGVLTRISQSANDISADEGSTSQAPVGWIKGKNFPVYQENSSNQNPWKLVPINPFDVNPLNRIHRNKSLPNIFNAAAPSIFQFKDYLFGNRGVIRSGNFAGTIKDIYNSKYDKPLVSWNSTLVDEMNYAIRKICLLKAIELVKEPAVEGAEDRIFYFSDTDRFVVLTDTTDMETVNSTSAYYVVNSDATKSTILNKISTKNVECTLDLSLTNFELSSEDIPSCVKNIIMPYNIGFGDIDLSNIALNSITYLSKGESNNYNHNSNTTIYAQLSSYISGLSSSILNKTYFCTFIQDFEPLFDDILSRVTSGNISMSLKILDTSFLEGKTVNTSIQPGKIYNNLSIEDILSNFKNFRAYYSLRETLFRILDKIPENRKLTIPNLDLTSCYHIYQDEYPYLNYQFRDSFFSNPNFNNKYSATDIDVKYNMSPTGTKIAISNIIYPDKFQIMKVYDETNNGQTIQHREYPYTYDYLEHTYTYEQLGPNTTNLTYADLNAGLVKGRRTYSESLVNGPSGS